MPRDKGDLRSVVSGEEIQIVKPLDTVNRSARSFFSHAKNGPAKAKRVVTVVKTELLVDGVYGSSK